MPAVNPLILLMFLAVTDTDAEVITGTDIELTQRVQM